MRPLTAWLSSLTVIGVLVTALDAQKFEIHPYAGGFFSGKAADILSVRNRPIYGIKGGMFANKNFEVEGHFGYIDNLAYVGTLTRKKAYIWEGLATYNLWKFYGSYGLGAVSTSVSDDSVDFFGNAIPKRDTFVAMSYGGGLKV